MSNVYKLHWPIGHICQISVYVIVCIMNLSYYQRSVMLCYRIPGPIHFMCMDSLCWCGFHSWNPNGSKKSWFLSLYYILTIYTRTEIVSTILSMIKNPCFHQPRYIMWGVMVMIMLYLISRLTRTSLMISH